MGLGTRTDRLKPRKDHSLPRLFTIGHGTNTREEFVDLLRDTGTEALVDVRIAPGSRRSPQFMREALESWLPPTGVRYRWDRRLGGFRSASPTAPDTALRNASFRGYAEYMRSAEFRDAIGELRRQSFELTTTVMCSESVWWRCHRRLIADHLALLYDDEIFHVMPDGRLKPHVPTSGGRIAGAELVYDVDEQIRTSERS